MLNKKLISQAATALQSKNTNEQGKKTKVNSQVVALVDTARILQKVCTWSMKFIYCYQWWIQNYQEGVGAPIPEGPLTSLLFGIIFAENCIKMKKID